MTAVLLAGALLLLLLVGAVAVPRLLGAASPTFAARPRLGMAAWTASAVLWTLALLALGPLLAWGMSGPSLPGQVGAVCRRCLASANPFADAPWTTGIPTAALLVVPAVLGGALLVRAAGRSVRAARAARAHAHAARAAGERRAVAGHVAWVLPTDERLAYSMPTRHGGMFLSRGTLDALGPDELAAVTAHERAHLAQRHHTVLGVLDDLRAVVGRSPLVAAAAPAVAALAEMAADDAARRAAGTHAVARALLSLSTPRTSPAGALHAASDGASWRARRLVHAPTPAPRWQLAIVGAYLTAALVGVLGVVGPYAHVLIAAAC